MARTQCQSAEQTHVSQAAKMFARSFASERQIAGADGRDGRCSRAMPLIVYHTKLLIRLDHELKGK